MSQDGVADASALTLGPSSLGPVCSEAASALLSMNVPVNKSGLTLGHSSEVEPSSLLPNVPADMSALTPGSTPKTASSSPLPDVSADASAFTLGHIPDTASSSPLPDLTLGPCSEAASSSLPREVPGDTSAPTLVSSTLLDVWVNNTSALFLGPGVEATASCPWLDIPSDTSALTHGSGPDAEPSALSLDVSVDTSLACSLSPTDSMKPSKLFEPCTAF
mmetsp:Transcript_41393/g.96707  ORF Transcript_41393/g.96707 Transcript_41393/m.96707 type:complete len:219 (-) Transcript_41393:241-897(-)